MQVEPNRVVSLEYTLTDTSGEVIDSSEGSGPLSYIHGMGNIIPGLEHQLEGMESGARFSADVTPQDGYGEYNDELVFSLPRDRFSEFGELAIGMQFEAETDDGTQVMAIKGLSDDEVTVDANHPLAGQQLHFEGKIVSVREATKEELSHGHVHGDHDHHH